MIRLTIISIALILIPMQNVFCVDKIEKHIFDSLYDKAWDIVEEGGDLSIAYDISEKLLDISIRNKNTGHIIISFYLQGYIFQEQKLYDKAATKFYTGLEYCNSYDGKHKHLYQIIHLQNLGVIYDNTYSHSSALNYFNEALQIAESTGLKNSVKLLCNNLGIVYFKLEDFDASLKYFKRSLNATEKNDFFYLAKVNNSIGNIYNNKERFETAKNYYVKAINLVKNAENQENLAYYISNLGENLFKQGQIDESIKYYKEAVDLALSHEDFHKAKSLHNNLGDAYLAQLNNQEAINQYERAIALCDPEIYDPQYLRALRNIIKAYQQIGAYKKALHYQELQTQAKLLEQKSQYKVKEVELEVENQSSKEKLDSFASEKSHFITIIIGVFMSLNCLLLIAFAYYKGRPFLKRVFSSKP